MQLAPPKAAEAEGLTGKGGKVVRLQMKKGWKGQKGGWGWWGDGEMAESIKGGVLFERSLASRDKAEQKCLVTVE